VSPEPRLVFLYGPPAVGKLTVAKALAERTGFRVLHNHVTLDAVAAVLPFGTDAFFAAVDRLREDLLESAAREGIDLIYTFVFASVDQPHVERAASAYESVGGLVLFVQLFAPPDELRRRVGNEDRREHQKIVDVEPLDRVLREYDLYASIPGRDSLTIDLASTSATEAADLIVVALRS
jgi:hypothetical protein